MTTREQYAPGPANLARVDKDGENWMLVVVRQLRHSPEKVWRALTDPAQLREWAPFDADGNMGIAGSTVKLNTVGTPTPLISETRIKRAEEPNVLEYSWGDGEMRWELENFDGGTRLTLWHKIDRRYISMGAAGWHICLDVMDHALSGTPLGRIVGPETMKFEGWQRLNADYAKQFGHEPRNDIGPSSDNESTRQ
jgi:uncharacterized protein YndB with AHSA1/START domain